MTWTCKLCGRRTKGGKEICHGCLIDEDYDEFGQGQQRRKYQEEYAKEQAERILNHMNRIKQEEEAMRRKGLNPMID